MIERRRQRKMEEERNATNQVTINTAVATPNSPSTGPNDLVTRLARLKQMFEAGLISEAEFMAKKTEIINSI